MWTLQLGSFVVFFLGGGGSVVSPPPPPTSHILLYITISLFCYIFYFLKQFSSQNLIFIDLIAWGLQLYLKRDSGTVFFRWILRTFSEHPFYRTHLGGCFWKKGEASRRCLLKLLPQKFQKFPRSHALSSYSCEWGNFFCKWLFPWKLRKFRLAVLHSLPHSLQALNRLPSPLFTVFDVIS